jgi:hypothetical protein
LIASFPGAAGSTTAWICRGIGVLPIRPETSDTRRRDSLDNEAKRVLRPGMPFLADR